MYPTPPTHRNITTVSIFGGTIQHCQASQRNLLHRRFWLLVACHQDTSILVSCFLDTYLRASISLKEFSMYASIWRHSSQGGGFLDIIPPFSSRNLMFISQSKEKQLSHWQS